MAAKGDRAILEPQARRMYADGNAIPAISAALEVSATTLYKWKAETLTPGQDLDEWDRARTQKRGNIQRLRDLFERELKYVEEQAAGSISPASMDALAKLGALVKRWDDLERLAAVAAGAPEVEIDRPALFLENLEWIARQLKANHPEGLKVLALNFDDLIEQYKADHA